MEYVLYHVYHTKMETILHKKMNICNNIAKS